MKLPQKIIMKIIKTKKCSFFAREKLNS